jgi:hypothetical protein
VANAAEPAWQDVKQEAADELVGTQRHDLLAVRGAESKALTLREGLMARDASMPSPVIE